MISKEHAKEALEDLVNNEVLKSVLLRTDIEALKCAISALSEEDNTEWVDNGADDFECHCKKCGQDIFKAQKWFKFCPNCGRKAVQK